MKTKLSTMRTKLTLFALLIPAATCPASPIANWKVMFDPNAKNPATTGLNTDSPVFGGTDPVNQMDAIAVASLFGTASSPASVTLAVGESLTVSATITLTGGVSGVDAYRFAVLNDAGKFSVPSSDNWGGGWVHVISYSSSGEMFQAKTNGNYMSTTSNAVDLNAEKAYAGGALSADSATPYLWTMSITRDSETTVDLVSSFVGGPNDYSMTYTSNDVATSLFTYNSVGIQATSFSDLDQLSVSGAQFSVVPEPSAALLGGLGMLALLRRRRH